MRIELWNLFLVPCFWGVSKHLFVFLYFILLVKGSCVIVFSFDFSNVFACLPRWLRAKKEHREMSTTWIEDMEWFWYDIDMHSNIVVFLRVLTSLASALLTASTHTRHASTNVKEEIELNASNSVPHQCSHKEEW